MGSSSGDDDSNTENTGYNHPWNAYRGPWQHTLHTSSDQNPTHGYDHPWNPTFGQQPSDTPETTIPHEDASSKLSSAPVLEQMASDASDALPAFRTSNDEDNDYLERYRAAAKALLAEYPLAGAEPQQTWGATIASLCPTPSILSSGWRAGGQRIASWLPSNPSAQLQTWLSGVTDCLPQRPTTESLVQGWREWSEYGASYLPAAPGVSWFTRPRGTTEHDLSHNCAGEHRSAYSPPHQTANGRSGAQQL